VQVYADLVNPRDVSKHGTCDSVSLCPQSLFPAGYKFLVLSELMGMFSTLSMAGNSSRARAMRESPDMKRGSQKALH